MNNLEFNNERYYYASEVIENHHCLFSKLNKKTSIRQILKTHQIKKENYVFVKKISNNLLLSSEKNTKAILLLKQDYVNELLKNKTIATFKDFPILKLEENQKFKDCIGNSYDIMTRGERSVQNILFNCKDISKAFQIENLTNYIKHNKRTAYKENNDFMYIKDEENKLSLYLTYFGVVRAIFNSHSSRAKDFQHWAIEKIFTYQMGSPEEKEEMASSLIGVPLKTMKYCLSRCYSTISCIYLCEIGNVAELRNIMQLDESLDNELKIFKYGLTKDLNERMYRHQLNFNKNGIHDIALYCYSIIDPIFLFEAETFIKKQFVKLCDAIKIKYQNQTEIIGIKWEKNKKKNQKVDECFQIINQKFGGKLRDVVERQQKQNDKNQIETLEIKNKYLAHLATHECKKRKFSDIDNNDNDTINLLTAPPAAKRHKPNL